MKEPRWGDLATDGVPSSGSSGHSCAEWRPRRFGAETVANLSNVLALIVDPERLAGIGDRLIRFDTGAGFLARLGPC